MVAWWIFLSSIITLFIWCEKIRSTNPSTLQGKRVWVSTGVSEVLLRMCNGIFRVSNLHANLLISVWALFVHFNAVFRQQNVGDAFSHENEFSIRVARMDSTSRSPRCINGICGSHRWHLHVNGVRQQVTGHTWHQVCCRRLTFHTKACQGFSLIINASLHRQLWINGNQSGNNDASLTVAPRLQRYDWIAVFSTNEPH